MEKPRLFFSKALLVLLVCAGSASFIPALHAAEAIRASKPRQAKALSAPELAKESNLRIDRVPEFAFIREEAQRLGVKVYLFGGTAASYAHYVKEDLLRERGDTRYSAHRFDYDYTNIFRSTQDLDIVIDGTGEQAAALEQTLKKKFPHFLGDKSAQWEVRALRDSRADKEPILDNPSFANQHTDSHSTGLVEVTKTKPGESPIRDVRDWGAKEPTFLRDVTRGEIHYYFSDLHHTTNRAQKGLNPPILSAIRYLTKAFQYDLRIPKDDLAKIREIVAAFDPSAPLEPYVARWIEKNAKKLFLHSVDLENSWNQLEEIGLRKKLIALKNDPGLQDSLAWWMSKEPLRTKDVGQGSGKTAAEIAKELGFEKISLAHETNSFLAYESITRSRAGELNGLISRQGIVGEAAAFGEGFYTAVGRKGARNTGLTIRMELDSKAREGADFTRASDYFVLKNRGAVRVIPESIQLSLLDYFKQLGEGKEFSADDRALLEAFRRKTKLSLAIEPGAKLELFDFISRAIGQGNKASDAVIAEWFKQPLSAERPDLLDKALKATEENPTARMALLQELRAPHWRDHPAMIEAVLGQIKNASPRQIPDLFKLITEIPALRNHPDFFSWAKKAASPGLDEKTMREAMGLLLPVLTEKGILEDFLEHLFSVSENNILGGTYAIEVLASRDAADLKNYEKMVDAAMAFNPRFAAEQILTKEHGYRHPRFNEWLLRLADPDFLKKNGIYSAANVIANVPIKAVKDPEKWAERIINRGGDEVSAMQNLLLKHNFYRFHPSASEWIDAQLNPKLLKRYGFFNFFRQLSLSYPHEKMMDIFVRYFEASAVNVPQDVSQFLLPGDGVEPADYRFVEAYLNSAREVGGNEYFDKLVARITQSFLKGKLPEDIFDRWMGLILREKMGYGAKAAVSEALHWLKVQARPQFGDWIDKATAYPWAHKGLIQGPLREPPSDPAEKKEYWRRMKSLAGSLAEDSDGTALLMSLSGIKGAHDHPEVVEAIVASKRFYHNHLSHLFHQPAWRHQPDFQRMLGLKPTEEVSALAVRDAIWEGKRLHPMKNILWELKSRCSSLFGAMVRK